MCRNDLLATIVGLLLIVFCVVNKGEAATVQLASAGETTNPHFSVAIEKGYYRQEGFEVERILMRPGVANLALLGGNVEFSSMGGAGFPPVLRGAPLKFIFIGLQRPVYSIYARQGIASVKELKGKKVGVANIGALSDVLVRDLLKKYGLEPDHDVPIVAAGNTPDRLVGVLTGVVDAAILVPPFTYTAAEQGLHEVATLVTEDLVALSGGVIVREAFLQSHRSLVEKFIRGTVKGHIYFRNNRAGTIPIYARSLKIDESTAAKMYDQYLVRAVTPDGTLSHELQKRAVELHARLIGIAKPPPPETFFDFSLVRKIRADLEGQGWKP